MRVLPIIVVGSSVLSTAFAQQYRARSSSSSMCSAADQRTCCEMMLGSLEDAKEARHFCIEHGCNFSICAGKPSGSDVGVKMDDADADEDHDHDTDVDLWGSGGATQWGNNEDDYVASGVDKWRWSKDEVDSDWDREATASTILPSRSRQRKQRGLAWSPPNWGAPKYTDPKPYYRPPNNYYPPSAPTPYYPAAPEFVETCCSSNERVCPMDFPMQKQVLLSGKVRVCCFTSRINGGGGYYPYSYGYGGGGYYYRGGGGGYPQTSPRYGYGGGYGNRKLQYGYGRGGTTTTYGKQPSYYRDSYAFGGGGLPAQCPATQTRQPTPLPTPSPTTPLPTPSPTRAPTPSPTSSREPSTHPSLSPSAQPSTNPSLSPSHEPSSNPSLSSSPTEESDYIYIGAGFCEGFCEDNPLCIDGTIRYDQIGFGGIADVDACGSVCLDCVNGQEATVVSAKGGGKVTFRLRSFTVARGSCFCFFDDVPEVEASTFTPTPPAGGSCPDIAGCTFGTEFDYATGPTTGTDCYENCDDVGQEEECWTYKVDPPQPDP
eukprot:scaffold1307_cov106-Skeletonema_dohrnii-CCMP3373.AAC.7